MKLLVIIVTYNAMQWAERCFNSLRNSSFVPDVFVVDNGSTDGTQTYIQEHFPEVLFQQSKVNLGFGKANNLGFQYAIDNDYDYVYLLNQDAWVFPETFDKLIGISRRNLEYGILSPFQMEANMQHIDINFKKYVCSWKSSPDLLDDLYFNREKDVITVDNVMAAHWLITRVCLHKVGGFSPSFPHYGEDGNYIRRAFFLGFKIGIVPLLMVVHDREYRRNTKSKVIYLGYIDSIKYLSDPFLLWKGALFKVFILQAKLFFKYKSIKPIQSFMKICFNLSKILKNKKKSMTTECAFLKK